LAVKVRLTRVGSKKNPIWRVVVADGRSPRDGRSIETIGHYNPQTEPSRIVIDRERYQHWIDRGAQPSNTVKKLVRAANTGFDAPSAPAPEPVATPPAPPADAAASEAAEPEAAAPPEPEASAPEPAAEAAPEAAAEEPAAEEPAAEGDAEADAPADAGESS
jgi:small subunit ribosomal protein S16